jgi:hypothetical protein
MERRFADWRMRSLSEEAGMMINLVERGPLDSREIAGTHPPDSVLDMDVNETKVSKRGSNLCI